MDTSKHTLYEVSFGDSRKYKLDYAASGKGSGDKLHGTITAIEKELNDYLAAQFPGESVTYYTSPRVTEVPADRYAEVEEYPSLDSKAVDEIKHLLVREVKDMNDLKVLNRNAPFDCQCGQ